MNTRTSDRRQHHRITDAAHAGQFEALKRKNKKLKSLVINFTGYLEEISRNSYKVHGMTEKEFRASFALEDPRGFEYCERARKLLGETE